MSNIMKDNSMALEELSKGNELTAQALFRKNVKSIPCCLSLNNLGVYYSQYGMILKNGHIRSAKKIGLNYLLKASLYETNWHNCNSTATALLESGNVMLAYQFLSKAQQLHSDHLVQYNVGACLFRMRKFQEAASVFESLCISSAIDCIIENGGQHPFLILAYCQIQLHNEQECIRYIQLYRDVNRTDERLDVFHLRFLCGMYEMALSECLELLVEWYPTKPILAMIAECISYTPSCASTIDAAVFPEHRMQWNTLKTNTLLRTQVIQEYSYLPPLICLYQYIN